MGLFYVFAVYKEDSTAPVYLQLLRGIWAYMRCSYLFVVGLWDGDYVSHLPYVWYYVDVNSSFKYARANASPRCPLCFRCLMFSLAGP